MKLIVLSCDKYEFCWEPFFRLLNKYYPNHPECFLVTETKKCPYCNTINVNSDIWTKRFREALKQISDDQVMVLLDDFFVREPVDENRINSIVLDENTAVYNFETNYRPADYFSNEWSIQKNNQVYLNSTQPSIWNRKILIERLQKDESPWQWELTIINSPYKHFINNSSLIINVGNNGAGTWGVIKETVMEECQRFLNKEGLDIHNKKLSIITPYYKTLDLTLELSKVLIPQLNGETEWVIVDDGCNERKLDELREICPYIKIYHINSTNGHVGATRNFGLEKAKGKFIAWIDSDDSVAPTYVETLLNKIKTENFDYCYISWKFKNLGSEIIITHDRPDWNYSNWSMLYRREKIQGIKFNEDLNIAEDYQFSVDFFKRPNLIKGNSIKDILYFYNDGREGSLMYNANS